MHQRLLSPLVNASELEERVLRGHRFPGVGVRPADRRVVVEHLHDPDIVTLRHQSIVVLVGQHDGLRSDEVLEAAESVGAVVERLFVRVAEHGVRFGDLQKELLGGFVVDSVRVVLGSQLAILPLDLEG